MAQAAPSASEAGRIYSDVLKQIQEVTGPLLGPVLLWVALLQVLTVLSYWVASKFIARRGEFDEFGEVTYSSFKNALKVYVLHFLLWLVVALGAGVAFPAIALYVAASRGAGAAPATVGLGTVLLAGGVLLLVVAGFFLVPMRIYRVGFLRALIFLVLAVLFAGAAEYVAGRFVENPIHKLRSGLRTIAEREPGKRRGLFDLIALSAQDSTFSTFEKAAADHQKPFAERHAALKSIYAELEKMRAALPPGDAAAAAEYEKRRARYEELLRSLRAEYAAHQQAAQPAPR